MQSQELVAFIESHLLSADAKGTLTGRTSLIEEGILDSMGLMQVVSFLEERTGIRVSDDDVTPDNFETVEAILALVAKARARRG